MSEENEENRALAEKAMSETLEFIGYVKSKTEKPGFFSFGEHELGAMRPVLEAHAVSIEAFATLGLAILEFRKKAYVSGGYHLRASWKAFEAAQELQKLVPADKVLTDIITFGLGFFALAISLLPPTFQWVAEFIGFRANRDEGMNGLMRVFNAKGPSSVEAGLLVSMIRFFFLDDVENAMAVTKALLEERPSSVYLCASLAGMHRYKGEVKEALELQLRGYALSAEYQQLHLSQGYSLSDLYWMTGEYEKSIPLAREYLYNTTSDRFRSFGGWKLGFAYWMTGQKDLIAPLYNDVVEKWSKEVESYDRFSARKCKEFLANKGFTPVEELMLPSIWMAELKQWELAISKATHALKLLLPKETAPIRVDFKKLSPATLEDAAVIEYVLGICEVGLGNVDVGLRHLRDAADANAPRETWITPYCNLAIAQAELKRDDLAVCEKFLTAAENPSVKQFDFDGRHKMACKKAHEQLDAKKAALAKK